MELSEELELPPWEKFRLYGKFPWKLCLHFGLVALVTALVITTNLSYAAYSRSVWLTIANVLYPPNYARFQSDLSSPFQYYIYTQNQTTYDANRLFFKYFSLANDSVNEVNIFTEVDNTFSIGAPYVVVHSTTGTETYTVEDPVTSPWPLSYHSPTVTNMRQFFNNLKQMDFHFFFRSNSNGAGYHIDGAACFNWHWHITYSTYGAGQILVDAEAFIQSSCSTLSKKSNTFLMATAVFVISLWYQLLLLKAIARQIIVISQLSDPLFWARWATSPDGDDDDDDVSAVVAATQLSDHKSRGRPDRTSTTGKGSTHPPEDLVFKYGGSSGQNSRFHSSSSAEHQRNGLDVLSDSDGETKDGDDDHSSSVPSRPQQRLASTGSTGTAGTHRSAVSFAASSRTDDKSKSRPISGDIPLTDPVSNAGNTHNKPLLERSSYNGERSRSHRSSTGDSVLGRQSRIITLATIEADLKLLTEAFESLTWKDRWMIFNLWFLVSTVGNLFGLMYSSRVIFYQDDVMASAFLKACLGVACLMYWFALIQYLEFFPRYYIMISMLKLSVPRVSQFLLGVLPIFIGYALLGMVCFGDVTDRFGDVGETFRTLFAVVNGDIIYDTFNAIEFAGLGGQLYLYVYILIFTYVVLMTIIAIVEEAFFEAQEKKGVGPSEYQQEAITAGHGGGGDNSSGTMNQHDANSREPTPRDSHVSATSSSTRNSFTTYQPPSAAVAAPAEGANENASDGTTTNPMVTGNTPNIASTLRRQSSLRPEEGVPLSTSGKRELPDNVRLLLRNVQRMPSLSGQAMGLNTQQDILNAAYQSGFGGSSAAPSLNGPQGPSGTAATTTTTTATTVPSTPTGTSGTTK